MRRAAPLPNSVRVSAVIFSVAMLGQLLLVVGLRRGLTTNDRSTHPDGPALSITETCWSPSPRQPGDLTRPDGRGPNPAIRSAVACEGASKPDRARAGGAGHHTHRGAGPG